MQARLQADSPRSFLRIVSLCWARSGLLLLELAWRWSCGVFLLALAGAAAYRIALVTGPAIRSTGLFNATIESTIQDPTRLSLAFATAVEILRPPVARAASGLAPLGLFAWSGAFALGRAALLRRWEPSLPSRAWALAFGEAVRLLTMAAMGWLWYQAMTWAAAYALGPATEAAGGGAQADPNLVLYSALVIILTIGLFTLWSLVSWVLVAAPLASALADVSFSRGLLLSLRARRVRRQMLEVNLAMAVINLGLIVLATVLSATPLPFEAIMQGWPLTAWWIFVTLLYLAASDFFKMVRLFVFLDQLRSHLAAGARV